MSKNKFKQPTSAVIAVTYGCNSRCRMCNIWQKKPENELDPSIYLKLPTSLDDINITGGEPFLRTDIIEILDNVYSRCHPGKLVISSNGFLTDKIVTVAKEILKRKYKDKVTIALSLDGIGEIHDRIRGVPNAFNLVMNTIKGLKGIDFNNIGIGFTFMAGNESEYGKVYELAKKLDLNFGATIAHNAENYFSTQANDQIDIVTVQKEIDKSIDEKIKHFSPTELGKSYYLHGLAYYAKTKKSILPCDALAGSFFMDTAGDIYSCNILANKIGNLEDDDFDKIWASARANGARCIVNNCPNPCWMVCTGKPAIKKHWLKAGMWILKRKLL